MLEEACGLAVQHINSKTSAPETWRLSINQLEGSDCAGQSSSNDEALPLMERCRC